MLFFSESSFAAASAPVRDARNTGFVELLAIIAIVILFLPGAFDAAAPAGAALSGALCLLASARGQQRGRLPRVNRASIDVLGHSNLHV